MGTTSDNMKASSEASKSVLGGIASKWQGRRSKKDDSPRTFVDSVSEAYDTLHKLIAIKDADFRTEKNKESENARKLAFLRTMQFHLEEVMDLAVEYNEGKS